MSKNKKKTDLYRVVVGQVSTQKFSFSICKFSLVSQLFWNNE